MLCFVYTRNGSDRSKNKDGSKKKSTVLSVSASTNLTLMLTCLDGDIRTLRFRLRIRRLRHLWKPGLSLFYSLFRISFEDVSTVSYNNKSFTVVYGGSGSQAQRITYKLKNEHDAVALFRTFTEYHTFYQCNTVKRSVIDQCTRTFLGRVVSLLLPSSDLGQLFLFDVQRTRRQAYSQAWNELNSPRHDNIPICYDGSGSRSGYSTISEYRPVQSPLSQRKGHNSRRKEDICKSGNRKGLSERENVENLSMPQLKKIVRHLQDARICQICMDMEVATAFCPCGHVVCCVDCSVMCKECPLCRSQITYAQRVFFPFEWNWQ